MAIMKYCAPCRTEKPVSEFNKHKKTYDGLTGVCKTCYLARYGRKSTRQRDIPNPDPLDRKMSRHSNAIKFLERLLFVYGEDIYKIDKTMKMMAEDTGVPERSVNRYLPLLREMRLLTRRYNDRNDRSKGYNWFVEMNNPNSK